MCPRPCEPLLPGFTRLFRRRRILANLYSVAIVLPTVWVTVTPRKAGSDGESRGREGRCRVLGDRTLRRGDSGTHIRSPIAAYLVEPVDDRAIGWRADRRGRRRLVARDSPTRRRR